MTRKLLLVSAAVAALTALPASALTYVGSYWVGAGPNWTTNPSVYSALEAAALIFGGSASDYAISIDSNIVTHTAWVDGWGDTSHLKTDWYNSGGSSMGTAVAETYSLTLGTGYNDPFGGPAFSAYVQDHDGFFTTADNPNASINYVFRLDGAVPEPATWAMMIAGFGMVGFAMRRRRKVSTTVRYT